MGSRFIISGTQIATLMGQLHMIISSDLLGKIKGELIEECITEVKIIVEEQHIGDSSENVVEDANELLTTYSLRENRVIPS